MTYEELKRFRQTTEDIVAHAYENLHKVEEAYVDERLPFPFKAYQLVTVVAEVTEETRKNLTEGLKAKARYQLGRQYKLTGMLIGYHIGKDGELRPCFWGGKPYYSITDKIISIKLSDKQNIEKCTDCVHFREAGCWVSGGARPDKHVDESSFVCGYYYERRTQ